MVKLDKMNQVLLKLINLAETYLLKKNYAKVYLCFGFIDLISVH